MNKLEKLLIKLFSRRIEKIEHFEKYDKNGNVIDAIVTLTYRLFWFEVKEHFHKGDKVKKDIHSFRLKTIWEAKK